MNYKEFKQFLESWKDLCIDIMIQTINYYLFGINEDTTPQTLTRNIVQ